MKRNGVRDMVEASIKNLVGKGPWMWCSFADGSLPEGSQFLGVAIVRAHNVGHAASVCWEFGINPGGELMAAEVPAEFGKPPPEWDHKLITDKNTIQRLTQQWHGCEAKTLAEFESEMS